MQITDNQLDEASLATFGTEVLQRLVAGNIPALAERFGYALALSRNSAIAIQEDLASSLASVGATALVSAGTSAPSVKYFSPNDDGLFALIECRAPTNNGNAILVELVVTGSGAAKYVTLEQISDAA